MMRATKTTAALLALTVSGCASHPILRDALLATAVYSLAAHHTDSHDGRKQLPAEPCVNHPEQCR